MVGATTCVFAAVLYMDLRMERKLCQTKSTSRTKERKELGLDETQVTGSSVAPHGIEVPSASLEVLVEVLADAKDGLDML